MIDLYVITNDEGQLVSIYIDRIEALKEVKSYQDVEHWQHNYTDGYEYIGDITK